MKTYTQRVRNYVIMETETGGESPSLGALATM